MKLVTRILGCAAIGVVLVACAGGPKPPAEATLKTEVVAAVDLNPNRRDTAQPVKLHVYYLKQDEAFNQATFGDLVSADAAPIAEDLLRRVETLIGPGETQRLDSKFDEQTKFIGVIAEFTHIDQAQWRSIIAVPEGSWKDLLTPFKGEKLLISLSSLSVGSQIVED